MMIFKKANWKLFSDTCDMIILKINLNDYIDNITEIFNAAEISIHRSKGTGKIKTVCILEH